MFPGKTRNPPGWGRAGGGFPEQLPLGLNHSVPFLGSGEVSTAGETMRVGWPGQKPHPHPAPGHPGRR